MAKAKAVVEADPPPKKEEKKEEVPPPKPYDQWVKFEHMDGKGGVEATFPRVAAFKKGDSWIIARQKGMATVLKGDQLNLKDGTILIIDEISGASGKYYFKTHKKP